MKSQPNHLTKCLSVGVLSLIFSLVILFAARKACQIIFYEVAVLPRMHCSISPSGLTPDLDAAPNAVASYIHAAMRETVLFSSLGVPNEFRPPGLTQESTRRHADLSVFSSDLCYTSQASRDPNFNAIYFDRELGQFVYSSLRRAPDSEWSRTIHGYAGPNGVSPQSTHSLGRFSPPLLRGLPVDPLRLIVFDRSASRFFRINFTDRTVAQGPEIDRTGPHPIQLAPLQKMPETFNLTFTPTGRLVRERSHKRTSDGVFLAETPIWTDPLMLVLDYSGRIQDLDLETLELIHPQSVSPYAFTGCFCPNAMDRLFAYQVSPLIRNGQRAGSVSATLSSDLELLTVTVFDPNGDTIAYSYSDAPISHLRGGFLYSTTLYLLEQLHPPVLSMISSFAAPHIEAVAGHRALFFPPDHTAARIHASRFYERFILALGVMSPAILFALILAWRTTKNAKTFGLPRRTRKIWFIATLALGLPAYLTYRLTRPREILVTCLNCGRPRRPDQHLCHNCQASWRLPELTPPTWRIVE